MAKNIPLDREAYRNFRTWIRTTDILWRDITDSAIVPAWGEAICREDLLDENNRIPGERAYITLKKVYPKLDLRWRKSELELLSFRPPKKFDGPYHGDLFALDIKQAYAQIYNRLFLHSDYPRKRLRYPLSEVAQSLSNDKLARNAVVGIARSTRNKWCKGNEIWYTKKQNRYLSPTLWAQIQCILNEIAQAAISYGAFFVNTDGYAFTSISEQDNFIAWLEDFGLSYTTCNGEGSIVGISSLSIPGLKEPLEQNVSKPTYHLEKTDGLWVKWWSKLLP